jgi:hypothetical protein
MERQVLEKRFSYINGETGIRRAVGWKSKGRKWEQSLKMSERRTREDKLRHPKM